MEFEEKFNYENDVPWEDYSSYYSNIVQKLI